MHLDVDDSTLALLVIDYPHHEIHSGSAYMFHRHATLGVGAKDEILLVTPDTTKWAHFTWTVISDDAFQVDMYEGTGLTTPTDLSSTIINANRNSSNTSGLTIGHTPVAGAGDGTLIWAFAGGATRESTSHGHEDELILKQNTSYLFRISGANGDVIHWAFEWYEHTNKKPGIIH